MEYPLLIDGRNKGRLKVLKNGSITIEASCPNDRVGLYKAYAVGKTGTLSLGAMLPEGDNLVVFRKLSDFSATGDILHGEARLVHRAAHKPKNDWVPVPSPELLFSDEILSNAVRGVSGALLKTEGDIRILAIPFADRAEFAIPPLFCFAQIAKIGQIDCAVFCIDTDGNPVLPYNTKL